MDESLLLEVSFSWVLYLAIKHFSVDDRLGASPFVRPDGEKEMDREPVFNNEHLGHRWGGPAKHQQSWAITMALLKPSMKP